VNKIEATFLAESGLCGMGMQLVSEMHIVLVVATHLDKLIYKFISQEAILVSRYTRFLSTTIVPQK